MRRLFSRAAFTLLLPRNVLTRSVYAPPQSASENALPAFRYRMSFTYSGSIVRSRTSCVVSSGFTVRNAPASGPLPVRL